MTLEEIRPSTIKDVPDEELLSLHRRAHQWFVGGVDREDVVHAHSWIVAEMLRRGVTHNEVSELDRLTLPRVRKTRLTLVPDYISLVGS